MQDLPKIVMARLHQEKPQKPATPASHPDADLLTAFAEKNLSRRERLTVIEHIASCADCREIVALALPGPEERGLALQPEVAKGWLTWPVLRWGIAAAGVLVITSAGILQFRRYEQAVLMARSTAAVAPMVSQQNAPPKSDKSKASPSEPASVGQSARQQRELAGSRGRAAKPAMPSALPALAQSRESAGSATADAHSRSEAGAYNPGYGMAARQRGSLKTFLSPSTAVPVTTGAASEVSQAEAVGKAKAAPVQAFSEVLPAPNLHADPSLMKGYSLVRWTISAEGTLQRSLDGGNSWEDVNVVVTGNGTQMRPAKNGMTVEVTGAAPEVKTDADTYEPRVAKANSKSPPPGPPQPVIFRAVSVSDDANEVWAGGSGASLYHTIDAGNNWLRVLPSDSGAVLTGDVISIQFPDPQSGTVKTSNSEIWITFDDGKTWHKQP